KIKLYENKFNKSIKLAAFGIISNDLPHTAKSPEYTTNGMLKKYWHKEKNNIYLLKSHSHMYESGAEPLSEYFAAQIASIIGLSYVKYDLVKFYDEIASRCPIFTSQDEGFLPMSYCLDSDDRRKKGNELSEKILQICGKSHLKEHFEDMMMFDGLICNIDRHLGNFGMMIDNDTQEFIRPAPLFDNGLSMMTWLYDSDLKESVENLNNFVGGVKGYFDLTFDTHLRFYTRKRHAKGLEELKNGALKSLDFPKSIKSHAYKNKKYLERIECFIKIISKRAEYALDFVK
ncbi:hypothetical protein BA723_04890, partial [Helicobacter sp. CLO-3]|uniref:hypothetical protein n=1 Tax=Helicobacter sp. CLO-3 TaxID=211 RepID=UPI0008047FEE